MFSSMYVRMVLEAGQLARAEPVMGRSIGTEVLKYSVVKISLNESLIGFN